MSLKRHVQLERFSRCVTGGLPWIGLKELEPTPTEIAPMQHIHTWERFHLGPGGR